MKRPVRCQRGVTLVELVISIVVIGIAVAGVLLVMNQTTRRSADPMIREQAVAIAQSYLEEIMLAAYDDPSGGETGGCESGETRADYDDVSDYNCVNDTSGAVDRNGNPISGLEAYNVSVSVTNTTLNGVTAKRIDVTVTHDAVSDLDIIISAYRTNY